MARKDPVAAGPDHVARTHSRLRSAVLVFGFLATAAILGAHAWAYRFLADDAFISFRYARNLARGAGLVFNPGEAPVEGYTNFLWVLMLAGMDRLGLPPERAAQALSLLATAALWCAVSWWAWRRARDPAGVWTALMPPLMLAGCRSIAVWSTSGLETRLFEALILIGFMRWIMEVQALREGRPRRSVATWLFALAALTRPDGILLGGTALAVGAVWLARERALNPAWLARALIPFALLVGGHLIFRLSYYGEWLPNTWYAKVHGTWWSSGASYLTAFGLEYALWLWAPLIALGVRALWRGGARFETLLIGALLVPHALYVAALGGDHFEYRPLDLYLPLLFLLVGAGAAALAAGGRRILTAAWVVAGIALMCEIPIQSHRQFPSHPMAGFPGIQLETVPEARAFLAPERNVLYSLPGLRSIAVAHRDRIRDLTRHFVAIRQEEHRLFGEKVVREGIRLRSMVERGDLPRDVHIALGAVGALPYYSGLRTLDVHGLTDRRVAHGPPRTDLPERLMAHEKMASWEEVVARGVDLRAVDAHLFTHITSDALLNATRVAVSFGDPIYVADVGDDELLLVRLPQGPAAAARRMPRLEFRSLADARQLDGYLGRAIQAFQDSLRRHPAHEARLRLAYLLLARTEYVAARDLYRELGGVLPDRAEVWEHLALCEDRLGNRAGALQAVTRGLAAARASADTARGRSLENLRRELLQPSGSAPAGR